MWAQAAILEYYTDQYKHCYAQEIEAKMEFVAIDVETANADMASICQIGLARYRDGLLAEEWKTYIDPEDYFDGINVSIHGIDESMVAGAPVLPKITDQLYGFLDNRVVVCHTHFDRVAIRQASDKYLIRHPDCTWLDSARVARRTWEKFAYAGYGLHNICEALGYDFKHHDALEDAKAAGHIFLAAVKQSGLDVESWLKRVNQPISPATSSSREEIRRDGNPEGPLYGEVVVFTGALEIPRSKAADMASQIGCQVSSGVTKKTTLLVVGDQDIKRLAGHEKSSKHRKAEELIASGCQIRIIRESDFKELILLETAVVA
ncbi:MAG: exonuclease domain-containing protein [Candidatus Aquicultor sp.]|nr:exonuclease domain-containing protein [Candidatus Aquicultor sp.]